MRWVCSKCGRLIECNGFCNGYFDNSKTCFCNHTCPECLLGKKPKQVIDRCERKVLDNPSYRECD